MKTVMDFIMIDDSKNKPHTKEIGRKMAKHYRGKYRKEPMYTDY